MTINELREKRAKAWEDTKSFLKAIAVKRVHFLLRMKTPIMP